MITTDYIAGFVDGEGYIGLIKKKSNKSYLGHFYKPCVKIAQKESNRRILDILKARYGGYISKTREYKSKNMNSSVMWEISNRPMVKRFLLDLKDKLYLKDENLRLILKYIELPQVNNRKDVEYQKFRLEVDKIKEIIYNRIREINRRGLAETE